MSDLIGNPENWFSRNKAHIPFMHINHITVNMVAPETYNFSYLYSYIVISEKAYNSQISSILF